MVWRIAYDAKHNTFAEASLQAAKELTNFIQRYNIPDKKLHIITHSYGGLVGRFILNNARPTAPYHWALFTSIEAKTKGLITIQAPHTGAQVADTLWGEADDWLGDFAGWAAKTFVEGKNKTRGRESMRRTYLEKAAASGGWMADDERQVIIHLVAGNESDPNKGGNGMADDKGLSHVAQALCYSEGPINRQGALCNPLATAALLPCAATFVAGVRIFSPALLLWSYACDKAVGEASSVVFPVRIQTDGFVETASGLGVWQRSKNGVVAGEFGLDGRQREWLIIKHNHNHGRWDLISRDIHIKPADRNPRTENKFLGSFIADQLMTLIP